MAKRRDITLLSETKPRAAATHKCLICDHDINPGCRHVKMVYVRHDCAGTALPRLRTIRFHDRCSPQVTED